MFYWSLDNTLIVQLQALDSIIPLVVKKQELAEPGVCFLVIVFFILFIMFVEHFVRYVVL